MERIIKRPATWKVVTVGAALTVPVSSALEPRWPMTPGRCPTPAVRSPLPPAATATHRSRSPEPGWCSTGKPQLDARHLLTTVAGVDASRHFFEGRGAVVPSTSVTSCLRKHQREPAGGPHIEVVADGGVRRAHGRPGGCNASADRACGAGNSPVRRGLRPLSWPLREVI